MVGRLCISLKEERQFNTTPCEWLVCLRRVLTRCLVCAEVHARLRNIKCACERVSVPNYSKYFCNSANCRRVAGDCCCGNEGSVSVEITPINVLPKLLLLLNMYPEFLWWMCLLCFVVNPVYRAACMRVGMASIDDASLNPIESMWTT